MQSAENRIRVVAEVGCNHKGDLGIAKEMIRMAALFCKADVVKFQKRCIRELLTPEEYIRPHPAPHNSYGATYGEHREVLEFDADQHRELMRECERNGILYSTSVWDMTSAKEMAALNPSMLKIPSATNQHYALQGWLCEHYSGDIHVSLGMTTREEIRNLVAFYRERGRIKDVVLYACTSGYPVDFQDVCLLEIGWLMESYGAEVKGIGYSGHNAGIAVDVAAMTIGRLSELAGNGHFTHIERHFTLDRTWKGTDHAASLEPDGVRRLCRDVRNVSMTLTHKARDLLPVEEVQRNKLKWSAARYGASSG